jgi:hypothetical protein
MNQTWCECIIAILKVLGIVTWCFEAIADLMRVWQLRAKLVIYTEVY